MTDKELLYVNDVVGHYKHFDSVCSEGYTNIKEANLKSLIETLRNECASSYDTLLSMLKRYGG